MSLQVCSAEFILSNSAGTGFSQAWLPNIAAERMLTSTKDGDVDRAPDPVPFIDGELLWTNPYGFPVHAAMSMHRGSRFLLTSNPNTLALDDVWTFDIGANPSAPTPSGSNSGFGIRQQQNRSSQVPMIYCRRFRDENDIISYVHLGLIDVGQSVHFRYTCAFTTPGNWRTPLQPRFQADARWTRLRLWTGPYVGGVI